MLCCDTLYYSCRQIVFWREAQNFKKIMNNRCEKMIVSGFLYWIYLAGKKLPVMICHKQSSELSDMWKTRNFLIIWRADCNSRIFRSLYLRGKSKFIVMFRWFVKTEMMYIQYFSFRVFKKYQSTLNGLKVLICRRTCRNFVMRTLNEASNLS